MPKHFAWIDTARWLGAVAVVLLHVSAQIMVVPGPAEPGPWLVATWYNSLSRWAVPVFVIISGYLASQTWQTTSLTKKSYVTWLTKRWQKLGWPLLFWHLVYLGLWHQPPAGQSYLGWWSRLILFDQPFEHLYFLWAILELYCLTPILLKLLKWAKTDQKSVVLALLVVAAIWPPSRWLLALWIPQLGYYTLGLYLAQTQVTSKYSRQIWWGGWGLATLVAFSLVAWQTLSLKLTHNLAWFEFTHPMIVIQSYCLVQAVRLEKWSGLKQVSSLTLGIYLMHPLLVRAATPLLVSQAQTGWWHIPLVTMLLVTACALITWVMSRTPIIKHLV